MCHLTIDVLYKMLILWSISQYTVLFLQQNTMPRRAQFQHRKADEKRKREANSKRRSKSSSNTCLSSPSTSSIQLPSNLRSCQDFECKKTFFKFFSNVVSPAIVLFLLLWVINTIVCTLLAWQKYRTQVSWLKLEVDSI